MSCKISIIVPVYNVELYLEKCLKSLVNQSLQEIEILIVNDGSKDSSQDIIDQFQHEYPRKILSFIKENGGLSDARNFGIDRAKGEFIAFVDSDDYVSETMFQDMYNLATQYNAEMTICNLQKVNEYGNVTQKLTQLSNMPEKIILSDHVSVFSDISYFACNKLFKRALFEKKRFKVGIHFEDIELIPQILLQCNVIAFTEKYHYQYLERENSISNSHTTKGLDILYAVESVEEVFAKSKFSNEVNMLRNFQILEAVYSYLAYLAFVKNDDDFYKMSDVYDEFIAERGIKTKDILQYRRFGKNYLLSLPLPKIAFYILYFFGFKKIIRMFLSKS